MTAVTGRSATPGAIRIENPAESVRVFQDVFNAGDLDGLVSLFEPDAVFVPAPGQVAAGSAAIREVLANFLAMNGRIEFTRESILQTGDMALKTLEWKLVGDDPDGSTVTLVGHAATALRRQPDGSWRIVIDNPFPFE